MPQPRLWINEIIDALIDLGGEGTLKAIYEQISKRGIMNLEHAHWQATVRRTIEQHSSDTKSFHTIKNSDEDDIFYAPKGLSAGHWAIRKRYLDTLTDLIAIKVEEGNIIEGYEGGKKQRYVNIYERDATLRKQAVKIHGTICKGCDFDFEFYYGPRGAGYIEVHHLRPISSLGGSVTINPKTDMTVLCSNCHRMVHRYPDSILSLEELRGLVSTHRKRNN
ncbi:HNH endonuclease [Ktedonobacter robiniae]|uniref:HNH domain-containing protein n=1 Tax=Ktedonobacter robiniae TaxID=2778365 RepID=A0ABQ3UJL8_9CHLR|nr:HNH endonuclease [Ktedonobacter robiniae]GHO52883.1 hypothetical protein KSB_13580 [Ktedonobacter robiniae]